MNAILRILGVRAMGEAVRRLPPAQARAITLGVAVLANLLPLVSVLLGWMSVADVVVAYWLDLVIVGGFSIIRILTATGSPRDDVPNLVARVVFFVIGYGLLVVLQAMFLVMIFGADVTIVTEFVDRIGFLSTDEEITAGTAWLPVVIGLFVSELVALLLDWFARGERHQYGPQFAFMLPFGRMIPMVVVMSVGGGVVAVVARFLHGEFVIVLLLAAVNLSLVFGRTAWMERIPGAEPLLRMLHPPEPER